MGNAIRWLKLEISKVDIDTAEAEAKRQLCDGIDNFVRERITVADQVIAASAGEKIKDGDVILTYAKSSLVQQTLVRAHRAGVKFRVIVIDSKPLLEGRQLARALVRVGLTVQYSLIQAIGHVIGDVSKVLLGAHAMMSNGRLFSRVGTALVAMMAHELDLPVIVCCESVKFTERVALDSVVSNELAPSGELLSSSSPPCSMSTSASVIPVAGDGRSDGRGKSYLSSSSSSPPPSLPSSSSSPSLSSDDPRHGQQQSSSPNLQVLNIMYDVTPAEYIKMVVTEFGSLPPSSVPVVHRLSTNS